MTGLRIAAATATLLASTLLFGPAAQAQQWLESDRLVLVEPNGRIIRQVPEYGTVRSVMDRYGRRLLLNDWDEVIAIEMTVDQYRQQFGAIAAPRPGRRDNRGFGQDRRDDFQDPDYFPDAPSGQTRVSVEPTYPEPPAARIERRDLDPATASVPGPDASAAPKAPGKAGDTAGTAKLNKAQITALQVYLDRQGMSPGVIDGRMGSNVEKAIAAWKDASGERIDPSDTGGLLEKLASGDGMAFTEYKITAEDAAGPYVASIPADYGEKAKLERLSFTSTAEMLAEKFHMDETYLRELNPDADFSRPGTIIKVVAPGRKKKAEVVSIIADKGRKQVRGYDSAGRLVVAYPATIGSTDTPSPSGQVSITRIAHNPGYTYNPKVNFKQGNNDKVLEVPPGPNGPVGSIWIALSKPTYGIHGTPDPSKIGKTASHGCVRLTNWDAEELASMVKPGVTVMFTE